MPKPIVVYGFETSNNFKVRIALRYKGIPFEFRTIDPADRTVPMQLTGQPLTPVLTHGDVVMFDSAAILRYLDANFPDTPRLFGGDYDTLREIEAWEGWARTELAAPLMIMVHQRLAGRDDASERQRAQELLEAACERLESRLSEHQWLVADRLTGADVTCAPVIYRVQVAGILPLPSEIDHTIAWMERVIEYDAGPCAPGE